jgi:predicted RNA-binding Zn ribbon-like protein
MAASTEAARFRQGAGRLCLDFVRTLRYRGTARATEELVNASAVAAWAAQCGPYRVDASHPGGERIDPAEARRLREAIHELLRAARADGAGACAPEARELVNRAASGPVPTPTLDAAGRLGWHAADPIAATLSLVARDALDLATSPAIGRVRECADPDCGVLFVDNSRPGSRRWCSMDSCGNRAKKNTLRGRTAAAPPAR